MKNRIILLLSFTAIFSSCKQNENESWESLLDKELSAWDTYLSFRHQYGYNGQPPKNEDGSLIAPIGVNKDEYGVFEMVEQNNESILKISGEIYGCLFTKQEYENYHLRLKVKWGEKKHEPREELLKDSGILYHSIGPHGAEYWRSWMLSQEFQIMEGHMGDYWNQATSAIDIRAYIPESIMNPVADISQGFQPFGHGEGVIGYYCMRSANFEKPHGEWNILELICFEDKSLHIVNGEVAMILQNSRYVSEGVSIPLTKGKIQLQSEAAEVFYKEIEIRNLDSLPSKYSQFFD